VDKDVKIVTFGEIMGRLAPEGSGMFRQTLPGQVKMTFAGAEANVAVSLAILGRKVEFVSSVPENDIGEACLANLKGLGVDTEHMLRKGFGRLGLFYTQAGANQRPSRVIYDRENSTFSQVEFEDYDWGNIFNGAKWLHVTGISPALSKVAAVAVGKAVEKAKKCGMVVSCDLNYRKNLWRWDESKKPRQLAEEVMREILSNVDVLLANEEDTSDVLGIHPENTDVMKGKLDVEKYKEVAKKIVEQFPNISIVATTLRESISANHNNWGAMLYDADTDGSYFAPSSDGVYQPYVITDIVDRVGGGDAFAAGLIYAMTDEDMKHPKKALSFATAASCLAHSIQGDFNYSSKHDVEMLMQGYGSGRIIR